MRSAQTSRVIGCTKAVAIRLALGSVLLMMVCLSACGDSTSERISGPCPHWAITTVSPRYMEAWVEALYAKDEHDHWVQIPDGVVGELPETSGWSGLHYGGGGPRFLDTGAPMEIYVRWQSLAEPQTYSWRFTVPDTMRQLLVKHERGKVWYKPHPDMACRSDITVGVAPGGRTIVWVGGNGLAPVEITRGQATVEPLGPYQGFSKGKYRPMHEPAREYIETHGIPYGSW